jgi:Uma2 family endonuclease
MPEHHPSQTGLSHDEYLALEQTDDQRYEYLAGEVFAMVVGSERHALISTNSAVTVANAVRDRPCRVYSADMKLFIKRHDKFCYPDVILLCEQGCRHEHYVEEPLLIIEVLSPSTEQYDRGLKFEHYRSIQSLRYYLLLDQDRPHAELFERGQDGIWFLRETNGLEGKVQLATHHITLPLRELYRQVEFPDGH